MQTPYPQTHVQNIILPFSANNRTEVCQSFNSLSSNYSFKQHWGI